MKDWRGQLSEREINTQLSYPVRTNFAYGILSCSSQFPSCARQEHLPLQVLYVFMCKQFHLGLPGPHTAHVPILIALLPKPSFLYQLFKCRASSRPLLVSFFLFHPRWVIQLAARFQPRPSSVLQTQRHNCLLDTSWLPLRCPSLNRAKAQLTSFL